MFSLQGGRALQFRWMAYEIVHLDEHVGVLGDGFNCLSMCVNMFRISNLTNMFQMGGEYLPTRFVKVGCGPLARDH